MIGPRGFHIVLRRDGRIVEELDVAVTNGDIDDAVSVAMSLAAAHAPPVDKLEIASMDGACAVTWTHTAGEWARCS